MAFNPFHSFRKHQKVILAVVTIMLMFVFGLTWGAGDITRYFGAGGGSSDTGSEVTVFKYPSGWFSSQTKVYTGTVEAEARHRRMVNDFIRSVMNSGTATAVLKLYSPNPKKEESYRTPLKQYIVGVLSRRERPSAPNYLADVQQVRTEIEAVARLRKSPPLLGKDEEAREPDFVRDCDVLLAALSFDLWTAEAGLRATERNNAAQNVGDDTVLYFGGTASLDDTLDFMLWKHQADRLGITYTDNDVLKGLNRLMGFSDQFAPGGTIFDNGFAAQWIDRNVKKPEARGDGREVEYFMKALAEEFRVQTAQESLLGFPTAGPASFVNLNGIYQPTQPVTPDEFLEFVRKERTALKVAVLTVPVANFIDPNEKVDDGLLRAWYDKYRAVEPLPDRPTPGFKFPRKIKVELATGDPESNHFKDITKTLMANQQPVSVVAAFSTVFPAGDGILGAVGLAAVPTAYDPLAQEYEVYKEEMERQVRAHNAASPAFYDPRYRSAAMVGNVLGLQQDNPLAISTTLAGSSALYANATAQAAGAVLFAATDPSPWTLGAVTLYPPVSTVRSRQEVQTMLQQRVEKQQARLLVDTNLSTLLTELEKIEKDAKPGDVPEKAKEYLKKAREDLGLEIKGMSEAKDRYQLLSDPAMKPFSKDEYARFKQFQEWIANARGMSVQLPTDAEDFLLKYQQGVYRPQFWRTTNPPVEYVYWFAEDVAAHEVPFEKIRADVLAAVQLHNARDRAANYVLKLVKSELKAQQPKWPTAFDNLEKEVKSYLTEKKQGKVFELDNVSRLWTPETFSNPTTSERPYYAYKPTESDIAYPPADFVDQLMTMNSPGDAVFVRDRPVKNFYVAVLLSRTVPTLNDFRKVYENADASSFRDPLWDVCVRERRQEFQKQFMRQMREDFTGELDDKGRIQVPADVRAKYER